MVGPGLETRLSALTHTAARLWVWRSARLWQATGLALTSSLVGALWLIADAVSAGLVALLVPTVVGIPLAKRVIAAARRVADLERHRMSVLCRLELPRRPPPSIAASMVGHLRAGPGDPGALRELVYALTLVPVGLVEGLIVLVAVAASVAYPAMVVYYLPLAYFAHAHPVIVPGFAVDSLSRALLVSVVGLPLALVAPHAILAMARAHASLACALLSPSLYSVLAARVEVLTESRARAIDAEVASRRRIERDLHDGAQQRLVALALTLGMARKKMATEPEAASQLLAEAHEEAKRTLAEIRDLARGIHPAVLTDRGLDAAISALAGRSPVAIDVETRFTHRLSEMVESTAYFVVAEALTNVARHSGATRALVRARVGNGVLQIEVSDNGVGGADSGRGSGLRGLAGRLAALDGQLTIRSLAGGGTLLRAELPAGSAAPSLADAHGLDGIGAQRQPGRRDPGDQAEHGAAGNDPDQHPEVHDDLDAGDHGQAHRHQRDGCDQHPETDAKGDDHGRLPSDHADDL
jgi:signal transduction histidine kinase